MLFNMRHTSVSKYSLYARLYRIYIYEIEYVIGLLNMFKVGLKQISSRLPAKVK